jgi:hypothetical protein
LIARTISPRAVARQPQADGDLSADPRRVDVLAWVLTGEIREVTPIDLRWRSRLPDLGRSVFAVWRTRSTRHANPLSLGGDGILEFGLRDVETVLCGRLDAHFLAPLPGEHVRISTPGEALTAAASLAPSMPIHHPGYMNGTILPRCTLWREAARAHIGQY